MRNKASIPPATVRTSLAVLNPCFLVLGSLDIGVAQSWGWDHTGPRSCSPCEPPKGASPIPWLQRTQAFLWSGRQAARQHKWQRRSTLATGLQGWLYCPHELKMTYRNDYMAPMHLMAWHAVSVKIADWFRHPNKLTHVSWWYKIVSVCMCVFKPLYNRIIN